MAFLAGLKCPHLVLAAVQGWGDEWPQSVRELLPHCVVFPGLASSVLVSGGQDALGVPEVIQCLRDYFMDWLMHAS